MKSILKIIFLLTLFFSTSLASTINVPADIDSIQGGIDMAVDGDTVLVQPGIYVENINFNGKNIVVGSLTLTTSDTSYISQTVIDADSNGTAVVFENGEDSTAVLSGFTITNGDGGKGGGILCDGSNPKLVSLSISDNIAGDGGGICCINRSNPSVANSRLERNLAADEGGGICISDSSIVRITNVMMSENGAGWTGGGINCEDSSHLSLVDVNVSNNMAGWGGGIFCKKESNLRLENVRINENTASEAGGGILCKDESNMIFDPLNRSNIYLNIATTGNDLCSANSTIIHVVVDTFTVLNPTEFHAYPLDKFTFDIQNAVVTNISKNSILPLKYSLNQNHPNPFNPTTKIKFALPKHENVTIEVYNIIGQKIQTLLHKHMPAGYHEVEFNGQNLSSGVYLYKIEAGEWQDVKKMVLLK